MTKYIVTFRVGYCEQEFMFDTAKEACNYMDLFCDHIIKRNDGRETRASVCRIDEEENIGEEAKGEE